MALTVTHAFTSNIADDPKASAAGEVLPSHWNAAHTVTGNIGRTILTAKTQYYVRTDGSDSNNGLSNTAGGAWATLQHAAFFIANNIDLAGFEVDVNIGAGSFAGFGTASYVGGGVLQFIGAGVASTTITAGPNDGVYNFGGCVESEFQLCGTVLAIDAVTFLPSASKNTVQAGIANNAIQVGNFVSSSVGVAVDVSNSPGSIFSAFEPAALLFVNCPITIKGIGTVPEVLLAEQSAFIIEGATWTISGTVTISGAWAVTRTNSLISNQGTYSVTGSVTGQRYVAHVFSAITSPESYTLGPTYFPGTTNGDVDASSSYDSLAGPLPGINTQTGAAYTLGILDISNVVEMDNAGANTLTVPPNSSVAFDIGTRIWVTQKGAGATTVAAGVGVTVNNVGAVGGQWKSIKLYKRGADEWVQTNA